MEKRLHSDPLLPLWRQRLGRAVRISAIAFLGQALAVLVMALAMTGTGRVSGVPASDRSVGGDAHALSQVDSGGVPDPETEATDSAETEIDAHTEPNVEAVRAVLVAAGFPGIVVVSQNRAVTLEGAVPDEAARRAVVAAALAAIDSPADSVRLVDRLRIGP